MDPFIIRNEQDYEYAKERFREIFHACPCITDNEEGQMLYEALETYERQLKLQHKLPGQ